MFAVSQASVVQRYGGLTRHFALVFFIFVGFFYCIELAIYEHLELRHWWLMFSSFHWTVAQMREREMSNFVVAGSNAKHGKRFTNPIY